jgi:hypothetical protein
MGISALAIPPRPGQKLRFQPMHFDSIALFTSIPPGGDSGFLETPTVSFADDPLSFLVEALIAAEPVWAELPGVTPTVLRLALAELEGAAT